MAEEKNWNVNVQSASEIFSAYTFFSATDFRIKAIIHSNPSNWLLVCYAQNTQEISENLQFLYLYRMEKRRKINDQKLVIIVTHFILFPKISIKYLQKLISIVVSFSTGRLSTFVIGFTLLQSGKEKR